LQLHPEIVIGDEGAISIDIILWVGRITAIFDIEPLDPYRLQKGVDGDCSAFVVIL